MIDFSTLQGLTIPEGVVTEIADAQGRVLWNYGNTISLEVEKQTFTTYANETEYADESFVLLSISPKKSNSVIRVTYGGLTKTLTFSNAGSQKVYFGTFNGVTDDVETPASGTLTIEGECKAFATSLFKRTQTSNTRYCGITAVNDWGRVVAIPANAFQKCTNLALTSLPSGITSIGAIAFYGCENLALTSLPSGITSIGLGAFHNCTNLALGDSNGNFILPSGITSIGLGAFYGCENLATTIRWDTAVAELPADIFGYCTKIESAILPDTVTTISERAFYYTSLNYMIIYATTPPTVSNENALLNRHNKYPTVRVPSGCSEAYKSANGWSNCTITEG